MLGLSTGLFLLLLLCIGLVAIFEFVNGFHDTANAVATVIYTNSLKPVPAVIWSGICNATGVFVGGISVAMGIVNLLPVESLIDQNIMHSIGMVLALLLTAIIWNVGTWYFGIPASSSHTLIGSILGVGLAYQFLPESSGANVNWSKAYEIGVSLLISPLAGFGFTIFLMFLARTFIKNQSIFKEPQKDKKPPIWIRSILVLTCTGVSFSHGSNDGQKGVGLLMLVLIGIVPAYYAIDHSVNPRDLKPSIVKIENVIAAIPADSLSSKHKNELVNIQQTLHHLDTGFSNLKAVKNLPDSMHFLVRRDILIVTRGLEKMRSDGIFTLDPSANENLNLGIKGLKKHTDYAPNWVIVLIALSLGIGTMVGWKRIVVTIGEKIGKTHLSYAQGACSELVASSTIGLSTLFGYPVSTTQVLSSGIAGSMVASKGIQNLQMSTTRNILLAWVLTLPVCILLSGSLFLLFRFIL